MNTSVDHLSLPLRRQQLTRRDGYTVWSTETAQRSFAPHKLALLLCDVWDHHTCRGAEERLENLVPRMNEVVTALREKGVRIVHAPSDTMSFYEGMPARRRVLDVPPVEPPAKLEHVEPVLPVDQSDPCDTDPDAAHPKYERGMPYPWTREHPGIYVDQERDVISDKGAELWSYYQHHGIEHVLIMGVHTGMCILNRTFAIKQMARWGMDITLIRDLTDAMYNPAKPPYVSHEQGTELIVGFIEKYNSLVELASGIVLPGTVTTIHSDELLAG
jgi:nicotinamidase-related amidase